MEDGRGVGVGVVGVEVQIAELQEVYVTKPIGWLKYENRGKCRTDIERLGVGKCSIP